MAGHSAGHVGTAAYGIHRAPVQGAPPREIPSGRRAIIQWGDDLTTVVNVEALRTGARSGPNATGAELVLRAQELKPNSLADVREVIVVIHGEPETTVEGTRVVDPAEGQPRAMHAAPGLPGGQYGPKQAITPEAMAERLVGAGFGTGRWTNYRVRLAMCYSGVGRAESYSATLSQAIAARGVSNETVGYRGAVTTTGRVSTGTTTGAPPAAAARPGEPVAANFYPVYEGTTFGAPGTRERRDVTRAEPGSPPPSAAKPIADPGGSTASAKPTQLAATTRTSEPRAAPSPTGAANVQEPTLTAVGPQYRTPSNVVEKELERGAVRGGAVVLALQGFGALLTDLGDAMQQQAAETAFYAKLGEITTMREKNPGMGVIVEFVFYRAEPFPDSVVLPGDRFDFISVYSAQSPQDIQPGVYPLPKGTQLRIRRRWVRPVGTAPNRQVGPSVETRTPIQIANAQQLNEALNLVHQQAGVSTTSIFLAFRSATRSFAGARIDIGGALLEVPASVYDEVLPQLEQAATTSLTRRLDALDATLRDLKGQYDQYRPEGTLSRIWKQREFELPPPTLLDDAFEAAKLAREWLGKKDFELARSHLRTGNERARRVEFLLFHYSHGYRHWLEDES
jgi:hypothetical protein